MPELRELCALAVVQKYASALQMQMAQRQGQAAEYQSASLVRGIQTQHLLTTCSHHQKSEAGRQESVNARTSGSTPTFVVTSPAGDRVLASVVLADDVRLFGLGGGGGGGAAGEPPGRVADTGAGGGAEGAFCLGGAGGAAPEPKRLKPLDDRFAAAAATLPRP